MRSGIAKLLELVDETYFMSTEVYSDISCISVGKFCFLSSKETPEILDMSERFWLLIKLTMVYSRVMLLSIVTA